MRKKAVVIILTALVFIAVAILGVSTVFRVRSVEVNAAVISTAANEEAEELQRRLLAAYDKDSTFSVNDKKAKEIVEDFPYFRITGFSKKYPDKIVLNVSEDAEIFAMEKAGSEDYYILGADGTILAIRTSTENRLDNSPNVIVSGEGLNVTGERVLGVGDASGMIPVDPETKTYDAKMVAKFDNLVAPKGYDWKLLDILPKVLVAGENAGCLTEEGAKRLDVSGHLKAGVPVCPPEGDAGTGMVATNAVKQRTGNVSAGTSSFSMIVLEKELSKPYEMIDMVTTPDGSLVAMVHCNNCTSDLNAWVNLFKEYQELLGVPVDMNEVFGKLYNHALTGNADCGGLISYNYISGEPVTGLAEGRPLFVRSANDKFNLANFMRSHLYASVGVLKIGNDILFNDEKIRVDRITGHGGLFKTKGVGQRVLAAAINSPISVMETAGEGGAWGIALLGSYLVNNEKNQNLADFLDEVVFAGDAGIEIKPTAEEVAGFNVYIENYKLGLGIEEAAVKCKK